ncbi:hypothetical protein FF36_02873 [Frankia torreyi]|uniref:Uncharacterized protein n=1 Tax=Frankia torreyi TaxID=1856 RepID=A0A0D8BG00_9ACTN|nr:hypothetical protein FF36_02873 [Frankia torreyi]
MTATLGSDIRARKMLNKAVFTRLYLGKVHAGPVVTADDLNEPFATTVGGRAGLEPWGDY